MMTRSRAAAEKPKPCHLVLQVRPAGTLCDLGEISEFDEAIQAARQRGEIPENWDISLIDVNPERVIVACDPIHVKVRESYNLKQTWAKTKPKFTIPPSPKPKAKAVPLPKKLVGPPPDAAFVPRPLVIKVPGNVGQELGYHQFKTFVPRPVLPSTPSVLVLVQVEGEPEREARVRAEAIITEILGTAFDVCLLSSSPMGFVPSPRKPPT
jgi:hypothetical protein